MNTNINPNIKLRKIFDVAKVLLRKLGHLVAGGKLQERSKLQLQEL